MANFSININSNSLFIVTQTSVVSTECASIYNYDITANASDEIVITLINTFENSSYTLNGVTTAFASTATVNFNTSLTFTFSIQNSGDPGVFDNCNISIVNNTLVLSHNETVIRANDSAKCISSTPSYDDLTDTPNSKIGNALKYVRVTADELNHEYIDIIGITGDDVSTFAEKTGALVGTDRLVGLSGVTDFSETISGIPLSIFNNDSGWTSNVGDVTLAGAQTITGNKTFTGENLFRNDIYQGTNGLNAVNNNGELFASAIEATNNTAAGFAISAGATVINGITYGSIVPVGSTGYHFMGINSNAETLFSVSGAGNVIAKDFTTNDNLGSFKVGNSRFGNHFDGNHIWMYANSGENIYLGGGIGSIQNNVYIGGGFLNVSGTGTFQGAGNSSFAGNVGIGTTSPSYNLDVNGTGRFTGEIVVNNAKISTTPTTSTATYDILTRNYTTGAIEKISSDINLKAKVSLSSAQILNLNTTPITLLPAPGAGKVLIVTNLIFRYNYLTAYATERYLEVSYEGTAETLQLIDIFFNTVSSIKGVFPNAGARIENAPIKLYGWAANPTAGTSTVDVYVEYYILNL